MDTKEAFVQLSSGNCGNHGPVSRAIYRYNKKEKMKWCCAILCDGMVVFFF